MATCPSDCGARVVLVALRDSRLALVVFVVATMPTVPVFAALDKEAYT